MSGHPEWVIDVGRSHIDFMCGKDHAFHWYIDLHKMKKVMWALTFCIFCFSFLDVIWAAGSCSFHFVFHTIILYAWTLFPTSLGPYMGCKEERLFILLLSVYFSTPTKRDQCTSLWAWKWCFHRCSSSWNGFQLYSQDEEESWILYHHVSSEHWTKTVSYTHLTLPTTTRV